MIAIFLQTLPFFGLVGIGFLAGRSGFYSRAANDALTRFVFFFALPAMLVGFAADLQIAEVFSWSFVAAYLCGTALVYAAATGAAVMRRRGMAEAAVESQIAVIGNTGFLGIPMLTLLLGEAAIGPLLLMLAVDLLVFATLFVILLSASRGGGLTPAVIGRALLEPFRNPMVVAIGVGFILAGLRVPLPDPVSEIVRILGAAATPCALFVIGGSLAHKSAERLSVATWLSVCKLLLHPAAVGVMALVVFEVDRYAAGVMISAAALPVAGNVYMLAQHYNVAPARASAAILVSTIASILTIPAVVALAAAG
ncbi:AEC family transporter [Roseicyclus sp. F158]|uniref:AEC family transporter n=1 Tax=Tropicimonas omnivorans TaxID=3075590 RepID=A0ABU3DCJ7_9RHOB|nr:AEC family transporter [Roseicyclus sp. F158]MDT0681423.1 AEC family transporter [Roseicyclus sp. F158]